MYRGKTFLIVLNIIIILMMCKVQITESQMKSKFDVIHVNDIYGSLDFVPGTFTFTHTLTPHTHTHTHKQVRISSDM